MSGLTKGLLGCGIGCGVLLLLGMASFVWFAMVTPEDDAIAGSQMPSGYVEALQEIGALQADETIIYFYTPGLLSIEEGGSFFTDKRIVSYHPDGEKHIVNAATYEEVADISVDYSATWPDNTVITVDCKDGRLFSLEVTTTESADRRFAERLLEVWKQHGGQPQAD